MVPPDLAEEEAVRDNLLSRTPRMLMERGEEMHVRREALRQAVLAAEKQGLPPGCANRLREMVLGPYLGAFRHAPVGDPPARVEPIVVRRQEGAVSARARPHAYSPVKAAWLEEHFGQLEVAGMVVRKLQATFSSVAMAVPKGSSF